MDIGLEGLVPAMHLLFGDIHMIGHFRRCGLTPQTVAKLASGNIGLFLHFDSGAAEVRTLAKMVDNSTTDADASVASKGSALAQRVVLCCCDQAKIADLDQILNLNRGIHSTMHMPRDLSHKFHMACDQLLDVRFLFQILVSHHWGPVLAPPTDEKKRIPP